MITHSKVVLDEDDIIGVEGVLRSGLLAQGKNVSSLEDEFASFIGVNHAVAVSSGTAALHLSLLALGIANGSEVIVPSFVCTALLNAVYYLKATPIVVDIDPGTYNISADQVKRAVSAKTGAIIVPHMFGLPADMDGILSLGVPVIEDCAQSVGAKYNEKYTGSLGIMSVFSLYATKMLCAGEGGLVLSNDIEVIERVRDLRDYDERESYAVRHNYKLTDMQAALGRSQLAKLPQFIRKRQKIAGIYNNGLSGGVPRIPMPAEGKEHIYYRYVIPVDDPIALIKGMMKKGIECRRPVFKPLHKYLHLSGYTRTEQAWSMAVSIPIYPSLTQSDAHEIVGAIRAVLKI